MFAECLHTARLSLIHLILLFLAVEFALFRIILRRPSFFQYFWFRKQFVYNLKNNNNLIFTTAAVWTTERVLGGFKKPIFFNYILITASHVI